MSIMHDLPVAQDEDRERDDKTPDVEEKLNGLGCLDIGPYPQVADTVFDKNCSKIVVIAEHGRVNAALFFCVIGPTIMIGDKVSP